MSQSHHPSRQELLDLLNYDSVSGQLTWKKSTRVTKPGKIAGSVKKDGYVIVKINRHFYRAHRLIYFMQTGDLPECVDHIDGNPSNNSWVNLRAATNTDNTRNQKLRKNNTSGFKGVTHIKSSGRFQAAIRTGEKNSKYLGSFSTPEEAHAAYCVAANVFHGEFANSGESNAE